MNGGDRLCFTYRDNGDLGSVNFGQFDNEPVNGFWHVQPLYLVTATCNVPPSTNLTLVEIPELVRDTTKTLLVALDVDREAIYLVHDLWYSLNYLTYREGMEKMFRIGYEIVASGQSKQAHTNASCYNKVPPDAFLCSNNVHALSHERPTASDHFAQCMNTGNPLDTMHKEYKFRHALAEKFSRALRRCKGRTTGFHFELHVDSNTVLTLFTWPAVRDQSLRYSGAGRNSVQVLKETSISTFSAPGVSMTLALDNPRELDGLLGRNAAVVVTGGCSCFICCGYCIRCFQASGIPGSQSCLVRSRWEVSGTSRPCGFPPRRRR
jgi:hypothetical protein